MFTKFGSLSLNCFCIKPVKFIVDLSTCGTYSTIRNYFGAITWVNILRIGFFVYEYPPAIVGGLGTYAENVTQQYLDLGHDVSVFTLNGGNLKTREILGGVPQFLAFSGFRRETLPRI